MNMRVNLATEAAALRVLVVQMGARRAYELARMLEQRGALAALQTSAAWPEGRVPGGLIGRFLERHSGPRARRTVRDIPPEKVRTTLLPEAVRAGLRVLGVETEQSERIENWLLGLETRRRGLAGANVVLTTDGNGGIGLLRQAKEQGAKIVTDIVITPRFLDILREEHDRWPGWESSQQLDRAASINRAHMEAVVTVSDRLLCPSETVIDGLATIRGFAPDKVARVPYGFGGSTSGVSAPIVKRILFAGKAGLRKGLPYLAAAARILRACDPAYEIRVAGAASDIVRSRPECADLTFLGQLGPDRMAEEFRTADVFCLPSLAEGMARVTLEALVHGIPCVVTRSTGSPVIDGEDGLIVPERDGAALAEAIAAITTDRTRRARMSEAALQRAAAHTLEKVGARLHAVLADLASRGPAA
jgi:glycosyltransferase involved in cell wall biosynthesis